jgi:chromosome segregation ATPase
VELQLKYEKVSRDLEAANEALAKLRGDSETLRLRLEQKVSDLESGLRSKEGELEAKQAELEAASEERNTAEAKLEAIEAELEGIHCRELTLAKEMELLNQVPIFSILLISVQ